MRPLRIIEMTGLSSNNLPTTSADVPFIYVCQRFQSSLLLRRDPELQWRGARPVCVPLENTQWRKVEDLCQQVWGSVRCEDLRGPVSGAASCSCLLSFTDKPVCTPSISLYRNTDILGIYVQYFSCYIKLNFFWTSGRKSNHFWVFILRLGGIMAWPMSLSLVLTSEFSSIFTNINFRPVILNWLILVKLGQQHLHPLHPVWLSGWPSILNSSETIRLSWTRVTIKHTFWR